jgi:geranylgeranyl pyrophosphate synthase
MNNTGAHSPGANPTGTKTAIDIGKVLQPIQKGLAQVEAKMKNVEESLFAPLAHAFVDLIGSGGKRLRPTLALLAAQVRQEQGGSPLFPSIVALAASVEMLHTATLVHDDVIDGALLRRGAPTLNAQWNRGATILAGNFMFARAAYFAAETNNPRVIRIFANTLETIVNGELTQLSARHDFRQDKEGYYDRIYAKTASLFAAATEAAAVLAGLSENEVQALRAYGHNLGMAFQIVDDILDFTGSDATLGKPAGSDLRGGTVTLPFFYFLQFHPEADQLIERLQEAYFAAESDLGSVAESDPTSVDEGDSSQWDALVSQIVGELRASPAVEAARREAETFLDLARANLGGLPDSPYRRAMLELCDFVVQRTY